jgi:erythromycin esterase-like protein
MKIIISFLFFLFISIGQSQNLKTSELLAPESKIYEDLEFLRNELQDKKIVMLGEQTHMYGNIFEMKARVLEYLHQELGFTTIAIESSMYDIWKMNQEGFSPDDFNEAIWGVWSSSSEFQRVVKYIEKSNLKVIGFDSQVKNSSQFVDDFYDYLENQNITLKLDEDDLGIIIEGVLDNYSVEEDDIKFKVYEKEINRIIKEIEKLDKTETNYYWKQFTKNLLASSQDAFYNKEEILTMDFGNKNDNIRDKQMADNLLSYIKRNPNEKIICWADNIHIIKDNSSISKPIAKDFISMGSYIYKEMEDKSYSLATIHANDSLFDYGTGKWEATPIKSNSFEDELNKKNEPYLFVSSYQEAMQVKKETRLLNFLDFTEARLDQLHDGYIFFQHATLPKIESHKDSLSVSVKQEIVTKKIKQISEGKNIVLNGQLLNKENNEPIPFATLILKEQEIYRVADEKGFFELPVEKSMLKNVKVEISSIGYESKILYLHELTDKTFLESKFEELEEVVIKGYLSPKTILKKAIKKKKENHPVEPFNFRRYGKVLINSNDENTLDLELITKDYDKGYLSPYVITQKVEQIKWNKNTRPENIKYSSQFFSYRQNAIRYANILHKRKYKKFQLSFVKSNDPIDDGFYIISFKTDRNKWNYTNKSYPTDYSGRIYINKENLAIVKVVENWETKLNEDEIEKHFKYDSYKDLKLITIKEENICIYADINSDGQYVATRYFNRQNTESLNKDNIKNYSVYERDSYLYDFEFENIEEIEFEWREKKLTVLNRVKYDKTFWNKFYKQKIRELSELKTIGNNSYKQ